MNPAVDTFQLDMGEQAPVDVRLIAGVGESIPTVAGWYVVCNGRVVLAADRSETTGWGLVAEQPEEIPKFHNQFARFRGVAYFNCESAEFLPWNTTKTGVDTDTLVWRQSLERMIVLARSVIDFLNELDKEKDELGVDGPLHRALNSATKTQAETISKPSAFKSPDRSKYAGPKLQRISYTRPADKIAVLMDAFVVTTAKAVGERSFDFTISEQEK